MKKILKTIIAGSLILSIGMLGGCNQKNSGAENSSTTNNSSTATKTDFDITNDITVTSREDGSGTRGAFIELFDILVKDENGNKSDKTTTEAVIASKTDVVLTGIASDKYAIGYVSLGSLNDTVKALSIDGVVPTNDTVKDGSYKISRPFMIATKEETNDVTKDFIDFILSKEGQEVVSEGYIAISDDVQPYKKTNKTGKIVVAGSSSVYPVMEKLKEAYLKINTEVEIEIQQLDSTAGMTGAIEGTCDIGMASRALKESEEEVLKGVAIANDGIAVVVNVENPMDNATKEEIKSIFTGEVIAWDEVIK